MIHQREKKNGFGKQRWMVGKDRGVREKKKLTCKAKEWYLAY